MSRRKPSADELKLWGKVAKTTEPLEFGKLWFEQKIETPETKKPEAKPSKEKFELSDRLSGRNTTGNSRPALSDHMTTQPVKMDHKTHTRLKRGKLKPEARIDLHGMTVAQAHPELTRFILGSHTRGLRLVLVITGKGKQTDYTDPVPARRGVLRQSVPKWLSTPPLSSVVLQVTEAHPKHGGGGAYYVYLRRRRQ